MIGYVFVYGVDGFGADTAPAHEEGVYLDYNKAFNHLVKLNKECMEHHPRDFYTNRDEYNGKLLKNIKDICELIISEYEEPPYGFYSMEEIEIYE